MSKPRTALVSLRLPWLYGDKEQSPKPGSTALLDAVQLRAIRGVVRRARKLKMISEEVAVRELGEVTKGLDIIAAGPLRDVGAWFPPGECVPPPRREPLDRRRRNKAARQARKEQRRKRKGR